MFTYQKRQETFDSHFTFYNWLDDATENKTVHAPSWRTEVEQLMAEDDKKWHGSLDEFPY